jgi:rhamnogalacturonyl hydrolase YesR
MMVYVTTFVVVTVAAGTLVHFVTIYPMPWWPDTLIMGLPFGAVAALSARQHRAGNRMIRDELKGAIER